MKTKSLGNRRALRGAVLFILALAVTGCGVKAPPVPPRSVPPAAISDLAASRTGNTVTLIWSIPTGKAAGTAGVAGFAVYRAVSSTQDPACADCPLLFRRVTEIDLERYQVGVSDLKKITFQETITPGLRYVYKVAALSRDGQIGADSNRVTIR